MNRLFYYSKSSILKYKDAPNYKLYKKSINHLTVDLYVAGATETTRLQ